MRLLKLAHGKFAALQGGRAEWGCNKPLFQTAGQNYFDLVRVGHFSLCSQVLLLPLGVRAMPVKVFPKTAEFGGCSTRCQKTGHTTNTFPSQL